MLKSLLIGLDGSDESRSVTQLGIRWARQFDARAVGMAVVDEPGIFLSEAALFAVGYHGSRADSVTPLLAESRHRTLRILKQFEQSCIEAGVAFKTLEDAGTPFVQILIEAQCSDLVVLGQQNHFDYGRAGASDETLVKVLQDSPRPVVAVPKTSGSKGGVVIAYDGSLQAARTLFAFEASGLGLGSEVHVVSANRQREIAARSAGRAVEFLRLHEIEAKPHPVDTSAPAAEVILGKVRDLGAGLLVMGAYGQPVLREFFVGSVTRTVLAETPVPVFCYH